MTERVSAVVVSIAVLALGTPAEAQLYRTRDASGRTVVTNLAGSGGRAVQGGTVSVASVPGAAAPRLRLLAATAEADPRRAPYRQHVRAAAARYTLPVRLIEAVIAVESNFDPRATSKKGAQGLMQLMPDTARDLAVADPYDPAANIDGGARYLRQMLDLFNQDVTLALAAYNAGPNSVRAAGGVPVITETVDYVRRVRSHFHGGVLVNGSGSTSLTSLRGSDGRLLLTNVGSSPASVRLVRDRGGVRMTNR